MERQISTIRRKFNSVIRISVLIILFVVFFTPETIGTPLAVWFDGDASLSYTMTAEAFTVSGGHDQSNDSGTPTTNGARPVTTGGATISAVSSGDGNLARGKTTLTWTVHHGGSFFGIEANCKSTCPPGTIWPPAVGSCDNEIAGENRLESASSADLTFSGTATIRTAAQGGTAFVEPEAVITFTEQHGQVGGGFFQAQFGPGGGGLATMMFSNGISVHWDGQNQIVTYPDGSPAPVPFAVRDGDTVTITCGAGAGQWLSAEWGAGWGHAWQNFELNVLVRSKIIP